nr:hypothetical protein [Haloprofundus salilacus]
MFADDFAFFVTLDPFGPPVPVEHDTVGVEHEDGVVFDRFDEGGELLSSGLLVD